MRYTPSESDIYQALVRIGLTHEPHGRRISVLCPYHSDKELGSALVYPDRGGFFKCYSCKKASNIYGLAMKVLGITFREALQLVGGESDYESSLRDRKSSSKVSTQQEVVYKPTVSLSEINSKEFNPAEYVYCRDRGIDQSFVDDHKARLGVDGRYADYMLTPIRSKKLLVDTFEARKIMQLDYLQHYFNSSASESELQEQFDAFRKTNQLKLRTIDRKSVLLSVDADGEEFELDDPILKYLMRPKTYYPVNSQVEEMLFDYDRLDLSQPLIAAEGIPGTAKIRHVHSNITALFGSSLAPKQLELLKMFPELWIISDEDAAADLMIWTLSRHHENIKVYRLGDDTAPDYVEKFKAHEPVGAITYLSQRSKFFSPPTDVSTIPFEVRRPNVRKQRRPKPSNT